mgnify:CR=1 FL=1
MAKERLIGKDAVLTKVTFGTEVSTGSLNAKSFYKVTAKAGTGSIFGTLSVGDIFYTGNTSKTLGTGDKAMPITETPFLDSNGWEMTISSKEVDVTLAADGFEKFRLGKKSVEGSVTGIIVPSATLAAGGIVNRFLRLIKFASDGSVTVNEIDSSPIFIKGVIQKDMTSGETYAFVFAQIELFGCKLGGKGDSAQEFESKFKLAGADPVFYTIEVA